MPDRPGSASRNRRQGEAQIDVLSQVLGTVRMTGAFFFHIEAHTPWGSVCPTIPDIKSRVMPHHDVVVAFHVVTYGKCWTVIPDDPGTAVEVSAGDVVIFARGDEHIFASSPRFRDKPNPANYDPPIGRKRTLHYVINGDGDAPVTCRYVCGYFGFDSPLFALLMDSLPRMFRARTSADWLSQLALAGVGESEKDTAAGDVMLARLAELMFVDVLRQHIDALPDQSRGWLSGLRDRHIGKALQLIHSQPAEAWTLDTLAHEVGLSRSVFAERFAEFVGVPPAQYLARWRLVLATRLLDNPQISIAQAGAEVGYESSDAFQRAFKRHLGKAPGEWSKNRQRPAIAEVLA